jgi:hypothetical protein
MNLQVLNCKLNDVLLEPLMVKLYFSAKAAFFPIFYLFMFIYIQKQRSTELIYFSVFVLFFYAQKQTFTELILLAFLNYVFMGFG